MNAHALKAWKYEHGVMQSPAFSDKGSFERSRKFLIRSWIHADYDMQRRIITIDTRGSKGKDNLEKLKKLGVVPQ